MISEYLAAGRSVPAFFNGMATGSDWMSAASFIGMAGTIFVLGYDGLAYIMGWTGGYVLLAVFLGPYLRKFGQFTIPDFLGARYGGTRRAVDRHPRGDRRLVHLPDRPGHRRRDHHVAASSAWTSRSASSSAWPASSSARCSAA